jgi:NADPH:quinone reductase
MRIIEAPSPGGPDALVLGERERPVPGATEVLIDVEAAGVNRPDLLQRRGHYPSPPGAPPYPGLEVAGVVAAIGAAVRDYKVGDRVCALLAGGGYAEFVAVDEGQVLPLPGALTMVEAASLPEAYFTVWSNMFDFGRLSAGESLLVHGGSSGIGVAAIQLATVRGHAVYTTAGSQDKVRFCEMLGARRAIDYKNEDFVAVIAAETSGRGVNVILDMVGGSYVARNLQALATEGRFVMIAAQAGVKGEVDILRIMRERLVITGSMLRGRSPDFKRAIRNRLLEHVWPQIAGGRIRPIVDKVFPFAQAAQAHAYMETGAHKGKIILTLR